MCVLVLSLNSRGGGVTLVVSFGMVGLASWVEIDVYTCTLISVDLHANVRGSTTEGARIGYW